MRHRNHLIDILKSLLSCCKKNYMVSSLLLIVYASVLVYAVAIIKDIAFHAVNDFDIYIVLS